MYPYLLDGGISKGEVLLGSVFIGFILWMASHARELFYRVLRKSEHSYNHARWRDNPQVFYRVGIGFAALAIFVILMAPEPESCVQNGVRVCSSLAPSRDFSTMVKFLILMGLAGFSVWHGRDVRNHPGGQEREPMKYASPENDAFWNRNT